jgi:hypothetical protein
MSLLGAFLEGSSEEGGVTSAEPTGRSGKTGSLRCLHALFRKSEQAWLRSTVSFLVRKQLL